MDQRSTTTSRLEEELFPGVTIASLLGQLLRAPVRDIPTEEDYRREQGELGVPTEAQSSRQTGQDVLDWLAQAFGVAGILRGSAAGREQELMGKQRGVETFGKEMMDTSRRAQPQRWRAVEDMRPYKDTGLEDVPIQEWSRKQIERLPEGEQIQAGRRSYQQRYGEGPAPGADPVFRAGARLPADVVRKGDIPGWNEVYRIGELVPLPGGRQAQYIVVPGSRSNSVGLYDGTQVQVVHWTESLGEALAKARQLQNRLALAAKDYAGTADLSRTQREVRFPWERGTSRGPEGPGQHGTLWRWDYQPPPESGRWGE